MKLSNSKYSGNIGLVNCIHLFWNKLRIIYLSGLISILILDSNRKPSNRFAIIIHPNYNLAQKISTFTCRNPQN